MSNILPNKHISSLILNLSLISWKYRFLTFHFLNTSLIELVFKFPCLFL